jgi:glutamine amidotransferase
MGWNRLRWPRPHPLMDGIEQGRHVYFVHSYFCDAAPDVVVATTDYGRDFAAIVARDNVLGVQFHPEKSQGAGLRLIENFVRLVAHRPAARPAAPAARGNA